ncbi:MAG: patatin-like phospholipase family protein [Methylococcales bacterium]
MDGGGYLGLATAAAIRELEDHFKCSFCERFDLFCGSSTGAIIATSLATGSTGQNLVNLVSGLGKNV